MTKNDTTETVSYEKGSWQDSLQRSTQMLEKAKKGTKMASALLWKGAVEGIGDWIENSAASDSTGENLYGSLLAALGASRKGDASKIKTVALAVRDKGLDLTAHDNLSKAYAEAVKITKVAKVEADEDDAAEEAIAGIEAPKSASSEDGAAKILLAKGVDGAVVAILDALGADNFAAHRAFLRAVSSEINDREKAVRDAEAKAKAEEAAKAKAAKDAERAEAKAKKDAERAEAKAKKDAEKGTSSTAKKATAPKAATTKAKPTAKATPVKASDNDAEAEAPKAKKAIPVRRK